MRFYLLPLISAIVLSLLLDLYIWCDIRKSKALVAHHRRWPHLFSSLYIVFALLSLALLVTGVLLPVRNGDKSMMPTMWLLFTFLTIFIPKAFYVLFSLLGRIPQLFRCHRIRLGIWLGLPLGIILFVIFWRGALFTRYDIGTEKVDVVSPKVPQAFDGFRIVQFSDAHLAGFGSDDSFIAELVDSINAMDPDVIVFTGDMVTRNTGEALPFITALSRLKARNGIYVIKGNHDYGDYQEWESHDAYRQNISDLDQMYGKLGWKLLDNRHDYIHVDGDSIAIIGVENWGKPPFKQYGKLDKAMISRMSGSGYDVMDTIPDDAYKVLLSHDPAHWEGEVLPSTDIDLMLAGHTHAMQMMWKLGSWKISPASIVQKYWSGLYKNDDLADSYPRMLYVNIGTGETLLPARIGTRPEITVITLRRDE